MAVDAALLASVQAGAPPVLRLYRWSPACLSFGRNQVTRDIFDPARLRAARVDVVRRPTGGLAVLHDRELTYAVVSPAATMGGPRAAYHAINAALVAGLASMGVAAGVAGDDHAPQMPHALDPCFQAPAAGEVVAGGGKLVGSAQRCERHTILQHGSILMGGDQGRITSFQYRADPEASAGVTLDALLGGEPDVDRLAQAIVAGFEAAMGTCLAHCELDRGERSMAESLRPHYESDDWTWRR
jgi:lipoate-protein ligase A